MKIRNKITIIIFTIGIFQLTSLKILAQELTTRSPVDCYFGILVSWSKRPFAEGSNQYVYTFQFLNTYPKAVKFKYWLKVGDKKFDGTTPMIPGKGEERERLFTDGNRLFTSTEIPECFIEEVCFEGMTCGGEDDCYAACSNRDQPNVPIIPCGLKSKQDENKVNPGEKNKQEDEQSVSGLYKIANVTITQNCTFENATALDERCELKYCIENKGPVKEGSTLILYYVHIYNAAAADFMSVDIGLGTEKSTSSNIELKSRKMIPPPIPSNTTPKSKSFVFLFSAGETPKTLYYKNVEITGIYDNKPRIKF